MSNDLSTIEPLIHDCELCCAKQVEVCNDLVCRACHKSLSFETCIRDAIEKAERSRRGLPPIPAGL